MLSGLEQRIHHLVRDVALGTLDVIVRLERTLLLLEVDGHLLALYPQELQSHGAQVHILLGERHKPRGYWQGSPMNETLLSLGGPADCVNMKAPAKV